MDVRHCNRCDLDRPLSDFNRHRWCKPCQNTYLRERHAANPQVARQRVRAWNDRNPGRASERNAAWVRAYPEKKVSDRRWRKENRDRIDANSARWKEANPERARLSRCLRSHRRRERLAQTGGRATVSQIMARIAYYGGRCWMCGAPWQCIDHVIAIARGGTGWASNLRPACDDCNRRKGARSYREVSP